MAQDKDLAVYRPDSQLEETAAQEEGSETQNTEDYELYTQESATMDWDFPMPGLAVKRELPTVVRRIRATVLIVLAVLLLELVFNYRAIVEGYSEIDLTEAIEIVDASVFQGYEIHGWKLGVPKTGEDIQNNEGSGNTGNDGIAATGQEERVYSIIYVPDEPVYVGDLRISGKFPKTEYYKVFYNGLTDFRVPTVQEEIEDSVTSWYQDFCTHIGKRVSALSIVLPKEDGAEITKVSLTNKIKWNPFRIAFFLTIFILSWLILGERIMIRKPAICFAVTAFIFGIFYSIGSSYYHYGWDEINHFYSAYSCASGKMIESTEAVSAYISEEGIPETNTLEEFFSMQRSLAGKGSKVAVQIENDTPYLLTYKDLIYLPEIVFIWIGLLLRVRFPVLFQLGRLGNLLCYILLMSFSIYFAGSKRLFLLFVALMPTPLFLAATYSYDAQIFACLTLAEVLWYQVMTEEAERYGRIKVLASGLLFVFGSLPKPVYIPLVLLLLLLPAIRRQPIRRKVIVGVGVVVVCSVLMATFILPMMGSIISGNEYVVADSRSGGAEALQQAYLMLHHPLSSIKLLARNIIGLDNFRNVGNAAGDNHFFLSLAFLNLGLLGVLSDRWLALMLPVLTLALLYDDESAQSMVAVGSRYSDKDRSGQRGNRYGETNPEIGLRKRTRVITAILIFTVIAAIWISMYLAFTTVGANVIDGVQMRYYLPFLFLAAVLVHSRKVRIRASSTAMTKCVLAAVLILNSAAVCELILTSRFS